MKRRHLWVRRLDRTACGLRRVDLTTEQVAEVTCGSCQRTERMALAELREQQARTDRARRRRTK